MLARQTRSTLIQPEYDVIGGNRSEIVKHDGDMYKGPQWFVEAGGNEDIYTGIYR